MRVGKWLYDSDKPFATDEFGNINNVLFIDSLTGEEVDKSEPEVGLDLGSCPPGFVEPTPMPSDPSDAAAASEAADAAAGGDTPSEADLLSPLPQAFVAADAAADRDIAEWLETANGFCAPVVRRRASETPTELAANRELLSEFAINVSNRKSPAFTRSASSTSIATLATVAHPLDSAVGAVEKLTVAQASVRKEGKLILAMVGLPARGKTYIARKLYRHLSWMGYNVCMCNVGNFRCAHFGFPELF